MEYYHKLENGSDVIKLDGPPEVTSSNSEDHFQTILASAANLFFVGTTRPSVAISEILDLISAKDFCI